MTDNPLSDWTTTDRRSPRCGKSLLTPKLKKRLGQTLPDKITGYSCDVFIIDDPLGNLNITQEDIDKVMGKVMFFSVSSPPIENSIEKAANGETAIQLFNKSMDYAYQLSKQSRVRNYE
jgi:hypothetical protein